MVSIRTVFGFGLVIPRHIITKEVKEQNSQMLVPMCHTCGQTSYFLGFRLATIDSSKGYKILDEAPIFADKANIVASQAVVHEYERLFGAKPHTKPTYLMYTDIKR